MNPFIRLIAAAGLGLAWYLVMRAYRPGGKIAKEDPIGESRRREISGALRALAFFALVWFIASTIAVFVFGLVLAVVAPPPNRDFLNAFTDIVASSSSSEGLLSPLSLWGAVATLVATVGAVWFSQRVARSQSIWDLGLRFYKGLPFDVVLGLLLGPLLFAVIFQIETWLGYIRGSNGPRFDWLQLAQWAAIFLMLALSEELVVRGYLLQTINGVWGGAVALVSTSVFWGLAHLLNPYVLSPRFNLLGIFNLVLLGLIFVYAYSFTAHLWLPIAFHFSWNFAEGAIFGFPVSGYSVTGAIFEPSVLGPQEMTGGLFGPEGGLVSLFAIVLGGLIIYSWERGRRPPAQTEVK